jgi:hypothetical protein
VLLINLGIIAPLWLVRPPNRLLPQFSALAIATIIVSALYIVQDLFATSQGDWVSIPVMSLVSNSRIFPWKKSAFSSRCLMLACLSVVVVRSARETHDLPTAALWPQWALCLAALGVRGQSCTAKALSSCALFLDLLYG